ncbi:MAG: hypothetical protein L0206_05780, partial [Actinobacteria bacterium]|nr:hypothetical protein [Actinomycetota bacterium]
MWRLDFRFVWSIGALIGSMVGGITPSPVLAGPGDAVAAGNSGSASWTIPIEAPPGAGGFAPHLALVYSSNRGDGPIGVGWTVDIPEIRCSARFGVPDLASCQEFELAGTLLVRGSEPGRYHTIVESFQRILFQGGSWTVEQPDGTRLVFGESPTHRVVQGGGTARWLLERMESPFPNGRVYFSYDRTDIGEPLPSLITYGGDASPGQGPREIRFAYTDRDDPRLLFTDGVERHLERRLSDVTVLGHGSVYRRYVFGYTVPGVDYSTNRSRLSWVQEFGSDCTGAVESCTGGLPKQTFRYRDAGDATPQSENDPDYRLRFGDYLSGPSALYPSITSEQIGEIDGDGLPDRLHVFSDSAATWANPYGRPPEEALHPPEIWINTGAEFESAQTAAPQYGESFQSLTYAQPRFVYQQISRGTYDGEYPDGSVYAMCSVTLSERRAHVAEELFARGVARDTSSLAQLYADGSGFFEPRPSLKLVDLDADGLADLVLSFWLHGPVRQFDCNTGESVPAGAPLDARKTVVFRNTGSGWVSSEDDAEAARLASGMPPFEELLVKSSYQTAQDEPGLILGPTYAPTPCALFSVWGFEEYYGWQPPAGARSYLTAVCHNLIDLAPEFVDFNGDGYVDIAVLDRDEPDSFVTGGADASYFAANPARTRVWIQQPHAPANAPRWVRAPEYDLPSDVWPIWNNLNRFAHTGLQHLIRGPGGPPNQPSCLSWEYIFATCSPNTYRYDNGVRLADLNSDGLTDVVWWFGDERGVLLNRGRGSGTPSSAWCASDADDVPLVGGHACPEAASYEPPSRFATSSLRLTATNGVLGDVNGDGFLDFVQVAFDGGFSLPVWIHRPAVTGVSASVWRYDARFDYSIDWSTPVSWPPNDLRTFYIPNNPEGSPQTFTPRYRLLDLNGDGSDDLIGDQYAYLSRSRHSDLLEEVDNGGGGKVTVEYASRIAQRDEDLESQADAPDVPWRNDAGPVALWRPAAVVSRVTVSAKNLSAAGDRTDYRYAHPRFDRELRADLGFGLVRRTRADGARVEEYFHQDPARTGRTARRLVKDGGAVVHRYEATWDRVPDPGAITGSTRGVYLARLSLEHSQNEYGGAFGAFHTRRYEYRDSYGYDFVDRILESRPTGAIAMERDPAPAPTSTGSWIPGLVAHQRVTSAGTVISESWLEYDRGRVSRQRQLDRRRDGTEAGSQIEMIFAYDDYGNLVERRVGEAGRPIASHRLTEFCYDGDTASQCPIFSDPAQNSRSVVARVRRHYTLDGSPRVAVQTFTPDPTSGVPVRFESSFTDEPTLEWTLDRFSRVEREDATPHHTFAPFATEFLRAKTIYHDTDVPAWREEIRYAGRSESGQNFVSTATVTDGLGGVWKTIQQSPGGYFGTATYRDPENRTTYETYPTSCSGDRLCNNAFPPFAPAPGISTTASQTDALGRRSRIATPDGVSLFAYATSGLFDGAYDVALARNAKGDLVERWLDGDRIAAVHECTNTAGPSLDGVRCTGGAHTRYAYQGDSIVTITDPKGNVLRYTFDTLGRVRQIDDPNTATTADPDAIGKRLTWYDAFGNVAATVNARSQWSGFVHDELDRLLRLDRLAEQSTHVIRYRDDERQREQVTGPGYSHRFDYDDMGRIARKTQSVTGGTTLLLDYVHDELGRPITIRYPDTDTIIRYEYAGAYLERVCEVTSTAGDDCEGAAYTYLSDVTYDELGRRAQIVTPAGTRTFSYNAQNRLARDQFDGAGTPDYQRTLDYVLYDELGNVRQIDGSSSANRTGFVPVDFDARYTYDQRNRLSSWTRGAAVAHYNFDDLGNLTGHAVASPSAHNQRFDHPVHPHRISGRSDGTLYAYDADGNHTSVSGPGGSESYGF